MTHNTDTTPSNKHPGIQGLIRGDFLGTEDQAFRDFVAQMPEKHWARNDLSAVRLGWEARKQIEAAL